MTKTKKTLSPTCSQDQQLWLFPELQNKPQHCLSIPSHENSPSKKSSTKCEQSTPSTSLQTVQVAIGECGRPIGESAPNAKYTDAEIDMVFELRKQGYYYHEISKMMDMPVRTIRTVLDGSRRSKHIVGWKTLKRKAKK